MSSNNLFIFYVCVAIVIFSLVLHRDKNVGDYIVIKFKHFKLLLFRAYFRYKLKRDIEKTAKDFRKTIKNLDKQNHE